MWLVALHFLIPILWGISLVTTFKLIEEKIYILSLGAVVGLALYVTGLFVVSMLVPFTSMVMVVIWLFLLVVTLGMGGYRLRETHWRSLAWDKGILVVGIILVICLSFITAKLFFEQRGILSTSILNAWGDLGWHVANITMFAENQTFPPPNPILAGTPLVYPFLINFFSGVLMRSGASLVTSVVTPALVLLPIFFLLWYSFVRDISGRRAVALLAVLLLLLAGGTLGWLRLIHDFNQDTVSWWQFLWHLPREYSGHSADPQGFHFISPITSLFLPQRSFLFGFPLTVAILGLLWQGVKGNRFGFIVAGVMAGVLPLLHAHAVLGLVPVVLIMVFVYPSWRWLTFLGAALVIGLPEVFYYVWFGIEGESFFRWQPGWTSGQHNWLWFWFQNTGLILPVTLMGLFLPAPRILKLLSLAALIIFTLANLFAFAPWAWDNIKLLIFWFMFSLPLVAWTTVWLWPRIHWLTKVTIGVVVVLHGLTGAIDLWKIALPTAPVWSEWSKEDQEIAELIRGHTKSDESVLTGPYHNNPVALTGRAVYLGFPGHVWSHGYNPWQREQAIEPFLSGALSSLPEYSPDYVLIGPAERDKFSSILIRPEWRLVVERGNYSLYRIN